MPVELGHIQGQIGIEIHSINAGQKCEWDENHRNDGEDTHDLVRAVTQARDIQIHKPCREVAVTFDNINDLGDMVVTVPQKYLRLTVNEARLIPYQAIEYLTVRPNRSPQQEQEPLCFV